MKLGDEFLAQEPLRLDLDQLCICTFQEKNFISVDPISQILENLVSV